MIQDIKPYPAYKDSGVPWLGNVPDHWEKGPGFAAFREKKIKNVGLKEQTVLSLSYGRIVIKPQDKLRGLVPESFETYQIVDPGDIIIRSTDLQNDWTSLRVGLVRNRGIITSAYLCFKTTDKLLPEYGYQMLHAFDLMKIFYGMGSGLRQNLDFSDFKRMVTFIPPKDEQAAIVRFLDHADRRIRRFIRAKRRMIELLNEQKQAIINHAVTRGLNPDVRLKPSGVEWLGDVPEHWEVWQISHFAKVGNGSTPSRGNQAYWSEGDYPWLNSSCANLSYISCANQFVTDQALRECHLPKVPPGSVLVAITGQGKTRGKATVLGIEATINQHLAYITPRQEMVSSEYLSLFLFGAYSQLRAISDDSGSTKGALTCQDLKHFKVSLPPIAEQTSIVHAIQTMTSQLTEAIDRTQSEIDLIREYRTRLITDVVTGKLDVRGVAVEAVEEELEDLLDTDVDDMDEEMGEDEAAEE